MATSGTTTFDLTIDELIEEAYERCGLELRTGYDLDSAKRSLNIMMADWANRGLNQWTVAQRSFTTIKGTSDYALAADVVDITEAVITRDSTDIQMERISRSDYLFTPTKTQEARPTQFFLDRQTTPVVKLFPTPENSTDVIKYNVLTRIQDVGDYTNNMEVVFRFIPCMVSGLAYYVALKRAPEKVQLLKSIYDEEFDRAAFEDIDSVSSRFLPGRTSI
jgi:hypothetical protein|tara:strand:+ start:391 stop:1050 length:660 start_codon:yes stop_codon:yes gene_type:complete